MNRLVWAIGILAVAGLFVRSPSVADPATAPGGQLSTLQADFLWTQLSGEKEPDAEQAMIFLIRHPEQAVSFLESRLFLKTSREQRRRAEQLMRDLDHEDFETREKATEELIAMGRDVSMTVRLGLGHSSLEVQRRAERILSQIFPAPNRAEKRAAEVLERIETAEAARLLRKLGRYPGDPEAGHIARAAMARRGVPHAVAAINTHLAASWQNENITPAGKVDDLGYLRRVSLDLLGRIPTLDEIRAFEKDDKPGKRARLVDRLLACADHARHWAELWTGWLIGDELEPPARLQLQNWLQDKIAANTPHRQLATELLTASGPARHNPAVHFLIANLGERLPGSERQHGQHNMVPITTRPLRLFLGLSLECTRCHDHPFNPEFKQKHYWGVNSFYRQLELKSGTELTDNPGFNAVNYLTYETRRRTVVATRAQFLDGRKPGDGNKPRRQHLAEFMVSHPSFARAQVNRIWGQFFGRGLCLQPAVDDFGEHNELVHPELMADLARDFVLAGHDNNQLIRWICASDVYQLDATINPTNGDAERDPFFGRMPLKPLSLEQLHNSIQVANPAAMESDLRTLRADFVRHLRVPPPEPFQGFDDSCGCSPRLLVRPRGTEAELSFSALRLINGRETNRRLPAALQQLIDQKNDGQSIDALYLTLLTRYPTAKEKATILAELKTDPDPRRLWEDVFWALLNSSEFAINH